MSAIDEKYAALKGPAGLLKEPATAEAACQDGVGRYRHFQGGSIYWHPQTGAHEVHGRIRQKWATLGWERSVLGYPASDESPTSAGAPGRYSLFQNGAITWKQGAAEAFETHGAIRAKFGDLGWEAGALGFPVTDESATADGVGRYCHFERGSIHWKPTTSAHETRGKIRDLWKALGWETNPDLGYPITDELPTYPGSVHRFSDFENGVLFWRSGDKKAAVLPRLTIGDASRTAAEVLAEMAAAIVGPLQSVGEVYVRSGPSLGGVSDYAWDGSRVRNRLFQVKVGIGIDVPVSSDPTCDLTLRIEFRFDRAAGTVWAELFDAQFHTHVPAPTSAFVHADQINALLKKQLDPLVGKPQKPVTVPAPVRLLSAKTMPNGDLNVYAQPLLTT